MGKDKVGKGFINLFITPKSSNKDRARREFILNILLLGSIILALAGLIENLVYYYLDFLNLYNYQGINPLLTFIFVSFLCYLLFLSRRGKARLSSIILISFLLISSMYTSFYWGADVPQALLVYALIIVISGILISTKFAFLSTVIISLSLIVMSILQINHIYEISLSWKSQAFSLGDTLVSVVSISFIGLVSWLFNSEIDKALKRAQRSEAALRRQKDNLEITVEKRTYELRQTQVEKVAQLYRFAEFGRSASGLFHDLVNPLTLISLNLNQLIKQTKQPKLVDARQALERAIIGTKRLESFIQAAKKQVQDQAITQKFSLEDEISQAIQMLVSRARQNHVKIVFQPAGDIETIGNPIKFNQLMTNLVSNAVDSYDGMRKRERLVEIRISRTNSLARLEIEDWGSGIGPTELPKIFDPLFTTKGFEKGTGIGLSICKDIIEKDFGGKYFVNTKLGKGTTFVVEFLIKKSAKD